ncbi:unnamed protein product [Ambrosiozyma monospora]|uniref:Unnamed protein product n=1 Tax=Ambrosiozyma monospora TaxID=43982 RepID=A0ACB5U5E9_AMBMO|nr:unnamed protein product [Ambrosiozyma monospora]
MASNPMTLSSLNGLINKIDSVNFSSGYNLLSYYAVDKDDKVASNCSRGTINAVTWGCFPGKEIVQPTVVDKISFIAWKDEFYMILKKWNNSVFKKDESYKQSDELLTDLYDNYSLVNIVDNDYVKHANKRIFELFTGL